MSGLLGLSKRLIDASLDAVARHNARMMAPPVLQRHFGLGAGWRYR
jgi:hypothetical protein